MSLYRHTSMFILALHMFHVVASAYAALLRNSTEKTLKKKSVFDVIQRNLQETERRRIWHIYLKETKLQ